MRTNPLDRQTRYDAAGAVDHQASAQGNLASAAEHGRKALLDKTGDAIRLYAHGAALRDMREMGYEVDGSPELIALKGIAMFPVGLVRDAAELAWHPIAAVKDLVDAAIHGIATLFSDR